MTWHCTSCGAVAHAVSSPDNCTDCGGSNFLAIKSPLRKFVDEFRKSFVLHAVTAHFPNALVPSSVILTAWATITNLPCVAESAFFMTLLAVLFVPVTLASGIRDWKQHYGGKSAPIFKKKITLSLVLLGVGVLALAVHPQPEDEHFRVLSFLFIALIGIMLCLTVLLGHYGGKLVFLVKRQNRNDGS